MYLLVKALDSMLELEVLEEYRSRGDHGKPYVPRSGGWGGGHYGPIKPMRPNKNFFSTISSHFSSFLLTHTHSVFQILLNNAQV